jgi:hypothetical protein
MRRLVRRVMVRQLLDLPSVCFFHRFPHARGQEVEEVPLLNNAEVPQANNAVI